MGAAHRMTIRLRVGGHGSWVLAVLLSAGLVWAATWSAGALAAAQKAAAPKGEEPMLPIGVFVSSEDTAALKEAAPAGAWTARLTMSDSGVGVGIALGRSSDPYHDTWSGTVNPSVELGTLSRPVTVLLELPADAPPTNGPTRPMLVDLDSMRNPFWDGTHCAKWTLVDGSVGSSVGEIDTSSGWRTRVTCRIPAIGAFRWLTIGAETSPNPVGLARTFAGRSGATAVALADPIPLSTDDRPAPTGVVAQPMHLVLVSYGSSRLAGGLGLEAASSTDRVNRLDLVPGDFASVSLVDDGAYTRSQTLQQLSWVVVGLAGGWFGAATYGLLTVGRKSPASGQGV